MRCDICVLCSRAPDREIVHSHDFNRYLTPFRAEWDPKDASERLFVIGRYASACCGRKKPGLALAFVYVRQSWGGGMCMCVGGGGHAWEMDRGTGELCEYSGDLILALPSGHMSHGAM